jgi:hypothetical protein
MNVDKPLATITPRAIKAATTAAIEHASQAGK